MAEPFDSISKLLNDYPNVGAGTLATTCIGIGFGIGWLIWQQRNSHLKQVNDDLKDALAGKLPPDAVAHLLSRPRRARAIAILFAGALVGGAGIGFLKGELRPLPTIIHDQPTTEQIKQAAGDELAKITKERDGLKNQNAALQRENESLLNGQAPPKSTSPQTRTPEEEAIRRGIWDSVVTGNLNALINAFNGLDAAYSRWPRLVDEARGRHQLHDDVVNGIAGYVAASKDLEILRSEYTNYADIADVLAQPNVPELERTGQNFAEAVAKVPENPPQDFVVSLRPLAGAFRIQMDKTQNWLTQLSRAANQNRNALK
jgi:hypothetical protein